MGGSHLKNGWRTASSQSFTAYLQQSPAWGSTNGHTTDWLVDSAEETGQRQESIETQGGTARWPREPRCRRWHKNHVTARPVTDSHDPLSHQQTVLQKKRDKKLTHAEMCDNFFKKLEMKADVDAKQQNLFKLWRQVKQKVKYTFCKPTAKSTPTWDTEKKTSFRWHKQSSVGGFWVSKPAFGTNLHLGPKHPYTGFAKPIFGFSKHTFWQNKSRISETHIWDQ